MAAAPVSSTDGGQAASVPTRTLWINAVADPGCGRQQSRGVGDYLWGHFEKHNCVKLLDLAKHCGDCVIL